MSASLKELSNAVGNEACKELDAALRLIKHCVNQLTDDQLWCRPSESMNSAANLLLHLCGNLRQWIVSSVGGAADVRDGVVFEMTDHEAIHLGQLSAWRRAMGMERA